MRVGVYGLGYVGAVTVACLAELGHEVVGVDVDHRKVEAVLSGRAPVVEPGLDELLTRHVAGGRITASGDGVGVAADVDLVILAVGTPSTPSGGVDRRYLLESIRQIGLGLRSNPRPFVAVASRSTSLPDVHQQLFDELLEVSGREPGAGVGYACHPEFLRETTAIADFFDPPMIVFGASDDATFERCRQLYPGWEADMVRMRVGEAAMVKYAANCFHAVKVTFANEVGQLCRVFDLDARSVMDTFCRDDKLNISRRYLRPGAPFGGSCLPKDLRAVLDAARSHAVAVPMLQSSLLSNVNQVENLCDRILALRPAQVALVGLAFKEGTDDLREAPMVPVVEKLIGKGVSVRIFDGQLAVDEIHGANALFALSSVPHLAELVSRDLAAVVAGADVVVVNHARAAEPDHWQYLPIPTDAAVLDLCGVPELAHLVGYEGLYWRNENELAGV